MIKKILKMIEKNRNSPRYFWKALISLKDSFWRIKTKLIFFKNYLKLKYLILTTGKINNLEPFERQIYSQNGEDGIIEAIFSKIGSTNKYFVEFGGGEEKFNNTKYLRNKKNWHGLWLDSEGDRFTKKEFITAENITEIFKKYKVPLKFDLLSIDVDGNDYWLWKSLKDYSPRLVIIEYNSSYPPTESKAIKYNPKFKWDGTDYFGSTLLALKELGAKKGYTLVYCESTGSNAFFIRTDCLSNKFVIRPLSKIYRPANYYHTGKGHSKSKKRLEDISKV